MADPKIVFYDIETLPDLQAALENWKDLSTYPGINMRATLSSICSFGYRVLGEKSAKAINAWDFDGWKRDVNDDSRLLAAAFEILKDADAVVTWNGKRFDEKFLQTRLAMHDMELLPAHIPHIDLCSVTRRNFYFLNNRLKTIAKALLDDTKLEHDGWQMWVDTHSRVKSAMRKMSEYNLKDVDLMLPLFKKLKPLIKNIPNHNLFTEGKRNVCPNCASTRLQSRGYARSKTKSYQRFQCQDCATWIKAPFQGVPRTP